jgi:hypothetical protein
MIVFLSGFPLYNAPMIMDSFQKLVRMDGRNQCPVAIFWESGYLHSLFVLFRLFFLRKSGLNPQSYKLSNKPNLEGKNYRKTRKSYNMSEFWGKPPC